MLNNLNGSHDHPPHRGASHREEARKGSNSLSKPIEAHDAWMAQSLGTQNLLRLYELLDKVIALEPP